MTGDVMAEDPLCTHVPGTFAGSPLSTPVSGPARTASSSPSRRVAASSTAPHQPPRSRGTTRPLTDEEDPRVRPGNGRAGRRGLCRKNGIGRVTVEELERIRARMPTPKMFR